MASPETEAKQGRRRWKIIDFRKRHYLNCSEVAQMIGVHPSQITRWEKGNQTIPQWLEKFLSCIDKQLLAQELSTASNPSYDRKE